MRTCLSPHDLARCFAPFSDGAPRERALLLCKTRALRPTLMTNFAIRAAMLNRTTLNVSLTAELGRFVEEGGASVEAPTRRGFGSVVLPKVGEGEFGGP